MNRRLLVAGLAVTMLAACSSTEFTDVNYPIQSAQRGVDDRHWEVIIFAPKPDYGPLTCAMDYSRSQVTIWVTDDPPRAAESSQDPGLLPAYEAKVACVFDEGLGGRELVAGGTGKTLYR
ncbi:hypothetical protein ACSDQ9_01505 [Aestuariimicrobium soli]|uniref:hypothetical protein n=1 Tax=Aestuariimicrobium soli TaxID=2035834 RepID=UPI003EBE97AA